MALNISANEMYFEHSAFLWNVSFGPVRIKFFIHELSKCDVLHDAFKKTVTRMKLSKYISEWFPGPWSYANTAQKGLDHVL